MEFYNQTPEDVLKELAVNPEEGLSEESVHKRQEKYGFNELIQKVKINPIVLFLNQFKSFIIYILLFAVVVSFLAGEVSDAIVVLIILVFNAVFGFVQEFKAEKAIDALKKLSGLKSKVIRDGKTIMIETKDLVPGDIVLLEEGNKIPADSRIIEATSLQVSEASLTGESVPVSKKIEAIIGELLIQDRKNMLFSGTTITKGKCKVVITQTGMETQIGKIAGMISEAGEPPTPLQEKLEALGKKIGLVTIIVCILVFFAGILKDNLFQVLMTEGLVAFILGSKEWLMTAVSLAVAAVPEGLPAIVTIALAIGVQKMVKKNALVRRLPSVETLGGATVICSDKTGTLTKNEMTVRKAYLDHDLYEIEGEGYGFDGKVLLNGTPIDANSKFIFKIGALCNDSTVDFEDGSPITTGDPTEIALVVSAEKAGFNTEDLRREWIRTGEEPFDSIRKLMSTVNKDPESKKEYVFTKGALESVLGVCNKIQLNGEVRDITPEDKKKFIEKNNDLADQALRVLGFAYKEYNKGDEIESDLIFVGLQGMIDPPHPEVKGSIQKCRDAGIRVMMITGDNRHTAQAIAKEIGIMGGSMNGADFAKLTHNEKLNAIKEISVFSRVEPAHKMDIVTMLKEQGEVVAMTGDGVNDAPAIKGADLGISMGISGTDVTKEASDMVLLDDNFTTIVNAVEEGRGIYQNITKFVNYLLSCNLAEVLVIFFAIIFGWPLPMTAIMILWMNLVTDGLPALALSVDPKPKDIMKRPPIDPKEGIMTKSMVFNIGYVSSIISVGVLGLFFWAMSNYEGTTGYLEHIQTIAFTALIMTELVRIYSIRSDYHVEVFSNKYLIWAILFSIGLQILVIYSPISNFFGTFALNGLDWGLIFGMSIGVFILDRIGRFVKNYFNWFKA